MKIDIIDCRGFVKTPPYNPYSGENPPGKNARRDYFVYTDNETTGNAIEKLHKMQ